MFVISGVKSAKVLQKILIVYPYVIINFSKLKSEIRQNAPEVGFNFICVPIISIDSFLERYWNNNCKCFYKRIITF